MQCLHFLFPFFFPFVLHLLKFIELKVWSYLEIPLLLNTSSKSSTLRKTYIVTSDGNLMHGVID